jgi:hypothetical protein
MAFDCDVRMSKLAGPVTVMRHALLPLYRVTLTRHERDNC